MPAVYPKLRDDLIVSRQEKPGGVAYVVKDPVVGRFLRFKEPEYFIARQLDGVTPLEEIRRRGEEELGASLSQSTLEEFAGKLQQLGLLETSPEEARGTPLRKAGRVRGNIFYLRFKVFDPDLFFGWLVPRLAFVFTRQFAWFSVAVIVLAIGVTIGSWHELHASLVRLYRTETVVFAWVTFFGIVIGHEFAHGLTCKRFGGKVHEVGLFLIYLQPAMYCNVSDAWLFPEKGKRLLVTLAGAWFEIFCWALATLCWRITEPATLPNYLALVIATTLGIKTLFNLNPLIKLDGYYLLSDFLEVPNLRRRAFQHITGRLGRLVRWSGSLGQSNPGSERAPCSPSPRPSPSWRRRSEKPVSTSATNSDTPRGGLAFALSQRERGIERAEKRESRIYWLYGLFAATYSSWLIGFLLLSLGSFLVRRYQAWGFVSFATLTGVIFRSPLRRGGSFVASLLSPAQGIMRLMKRLAKIFFVLAIAVPCFYFIRPELKVSGEFIILPIHNADVRADVEGIVEEIVHDEGDVVNEGDLLARLSDRDYRAELDKVNAQIEEQTAKLKLLKAGARPEEIGLARTTETKNEERLKYSRYFLELEQSLFKEGLSSKKDVETAAEQAALRAGELEESKGNLKLLLAGSRPEDIEATQAEISRLIAEQKYLQDQLQRLRIVSPIVGVVTTHRLKEKLGSNLKKGDLFAEVHQLKTVTAEITVSEKEISDVRVGQPVVLKARAWLDQSFKGTVVSISPVASQGTETAPQRNFLVMTQLDNTGLKLRPEMSGNAKIYCGTRRLYEIVFRRFIRFIRVEFWSWW